MSSKSVPQECQIRVSSNSVLPERSAIVSSKGVLQECHLSVSSQGVPQVGSLEVVTISIKPLFLNIRVGIRVRGLHLVLKNIGRPCSLVIGIYWHPCFWVKSHGFGRRFSGVVRSWNPDGGFGFIVCPESKAIYNKDRSFAPVVS